MAISDDAATAEAFLRAWLTEHHPAVTDPASDDFDVVLHRVEHDDARTLTAVFGVSIPMGPRELRPAERINAALKAMLEANPALRSYRIDVTATDIDGE